MVNTIIAGVDDAGRGPAIGPLIIAGVLFDERDLHRLADIGVRDSKLLTPNKRERLINEIEKNALKTYFIALSPVEIDRVVETGKKLHRLNRLEAVTMAKVITVLKPDVAYVDASDVLADRFGYHIAENLPFNVNIISEHKADAKYPIVGAASIVAKVNRDRAILELRQKFGDFGSGYMGDPKTPRFLKEWIRKFDSYPDFVRKSWKPVKRIQRENTQIKLT